MLSAANETNYLRTPTCCRCCGENKARCICQSCHDGYHRCIHTTRRKDKTVPFGGETTYQAHFCVERPFKPPPANFRPLIDIFFLCGDTGTTTYQGAFRTPRRFTRENVTCQPRKKETDCEPLPKTVYMTDYRAPLTEKEQIRQNWLSKKHEMYRQMLREQKKKNVFSRPKRPPRPYDYSKADRYTTGELYVPKKCLEESRERMEVILPKCHSDGAVNSFTTGTETKDTFRANLDIRIPPCCRPESIYHPDKLQTCIVCHNEAGKAHGTCPLVFYPRPERHLGKHPYTGPRPSVRECSEYTRSYRTPAESPFVIPTDASCERKLPCPCETCPAMANNLPIPVGYERCAS